MSLRVLFCGLVMVVPVAGVQADTPTAAGRPFTVDAMMKTQAVQEALFDPQGKHLLIEKTGAYETSQNFAWGRVWARDRAVLTDAVVAGTDVGSSVSGAPKEHIWLGSYSPNGTQAAIGWFDGNQAKSGVYDLTTRKLRKFDLLISNQGSLSCAFDCPLWLSETQFVHFILSPEAQKRELSRTVATHEMTDRWAWQSWRGDEAAVKVLGSGAHQSPAVEEGGRLVEVDVRTGQATDLAKGLFWGLSLAPDRKHLAVLRETGNLSTAGQAVNGAFGATKELELSVFDFIHRGQQRLPCGKCNATPGSLQWSPGGSKLFFGTRTVDHGTTVYRYHVYEPATGKVREFVPPDLGSGTHFSTEVEARNAAFVTPFVWLDENTPAVRVSTPIAGVTSREAKADKQDIRFDWYALPKGQKPVNLTVGLYPVQDRRRLEDFVAVHRGALFVMADGELWRLSADGKRQNVTPSNVGPLSAWCSVIAYWREAGVSPVCHGLRTDSVVRAVDTSALDRGWMTLRVMADVHDQVPAGELLFLNVDTGETARLGAPAGAQLVTASPLAKAALYRTKTRDGDSLLLKTVASQSERTLWRFNEQLAGVEGGTPVMLTRREPGETEDRIDWLLLPPGHQPGDRHPLLVYFYPDTRYSKNWRSDDLRSVDFLNQNVPAARGYAVLLATMKISNWEERGNPMLEMHEQLIHAAENVVNEGYADPTRWALMGHSYGGYGTNCVITQTQRFRAAASLDGVSNLTSGYSIGLSVDRAIAVAASTAFGVLWSEGGQGRMGVPPWKDPERYVRNSPLFSADRIQTPLMLIHGDDDFVDINQAQELFNALQRQGKDSELVRYWGEEHTFGSPANIRDMWQRIFAWFDDYLDVARDERGDVIFKDHAVVSRNRERALGPEDFARFEKM